LEDLLAPYARRTEQVLQRWLIEPGTPKSLADAMGYCVFGDGKRVRPALVWMAAEAAGDCPEQELTARSAVAVELVHCYSLVHDDLPEMDDDELRRGRPTAHVQFGQAMAVLAGDALLTRAFGVLAEGRNATASRLAMELAAAAGPAGMVAGQVADMGLCPLPHGYEGLEYIHARKTAAMIRAAARMGAISVGADDRTLAAVSDYGESVGTVFQLVDDLLDATGRAETLGKTPGKDRTGGKRTSVSELGLDAARRLAASLTARAAHALAPLGGRGDRLRELAQLLAERTY